MPWLRIAAKYEHRWPSRAISVYRPDRGTDGNGLYQVKAEVLAGALAAGKGTEAKKPAKRKTDGSEREAADGLDVRDPSQDRDDAPRIQLEPDDADRGGDELPGHAGA